MEASAIAEKIGASYIEFKPLLHYSDNSIYPYDSYVKKSINRLISKINCIKTKHLDVFQYMGWPVDYGIDVK